MASYCCIELTIARAEKAAGGANFWALVACAVLACAVSVCAAAGFLAMNGTFAKGCRVGTAHQEPRRTATRPSRDGGRIWWALPTLLGACADSKRPRGR